MQPHRHDSSGYGDDVPIRGRFVSIMGPEDHAVHNPQDLTKVLGLGFGRVDRAQRTGPSGVDPVYAFDDGVNFLGNVFDYRSRGVVHLIDMTINQCCTDWEFDTSMRQSSESIVQWSCDQLT